ncbi:MAG: glutamine amidotransferase family protein [Xanthobacteraceae bacterium]
MCGIVGIFLKDNKLEPELGSLLAGMLSSLCDRGPDSAGFAVYDEAIPNYSKHTLRAPEGFDFEHFVRDQDYGISIRHRHGTQAVMTVPCDREADFGTEVAKTPDLRIVGSGRRMEIFKDVGRPDRVAARFGLERMSGTHAIGHTRMATESAVTIDGAHPFSTGPDQCLVHNGSLSNHNSVRRELMHRGVVFTTENDSEVAAAFLSWKMREGASLELAMDASLKVLDGFYTFVIGTEFGFGVLRDAIGCKPAVMAETDRWVAFGTEYRALVDLPGVKAATVWEPEPAKVYLWERH